MAKNVYAGEAMCHHAVSFPDAPGLAILIAAEDYGSSNGNWSYMTCKAPVNSSPSTNQHPPFYRPDALPVTQPTVSTTVTICDGALESFLRVMAP